MRKILRYLLPMKMFVVLVFGLVTVQSLADLYLPTLMSDIVDEGIVRGDTSYIYRVGLLMLGITIVGAGASIAASYVSARVAMRFGATIRRDLFAKVQSFNLKEVDTFGTASLITRSTNDVNQVQQVIIMMLRMVISAPIMMLGGIVMALSQDVPLTSVLAISIPVLAVLIFIIGRQAMPMFQTMQKRLDRLNQVLRERLIGVRVIRAFGQSDREEVKFEQASRELADVATLVNKLMALLMPLMMFVLNMTIVTVIWFGGVRIDNGSLEVGQLMAFIQYVTLIMFSVLMATFMFIMIPRASVSASRINEVLETEVDMREGTKRIREGSVVTFRDVSFQYEGAEAPALANITFEARPGETTAIIGGTGSGKSTLLQLIPRFYDVTSGEILLDGQNIRELTLSSLREQIGYVPQKAVLFSGTVAENIRFGRDVSPADVEHASRIAQADSFVRTMEQGYDTTISQGGTNVSGGQKQRLSIARALAGNSNIFLFDDSFSALDYKTDLQLRRHLHEELGGATLIIVAQRVSTVQDANQIIVIDEGRIVGKGRHEELLRTCSTYRDIVESQQQIEEGTA